MASASDVEQLSKIALSELRRGVTILERILADILGRRERTVPVVLCSSGVVYGEAV